MHQLWLVCIDKKKHLPQRLRKGAPDTISLEDAVASGLVKPGEFTKKKGPAQTPDEEDQAWCDSMQRLAEQSLQMTPQMQEVAARQHAKQQQDDAARRRKRDRRRAAKK